MSPAALISLQVGCLSDERSSFGQIIMTPCKNVMNLITRLPQHGAFSAFSPRP